MFAVAAARGIQLLTVEEEEEGAAVAFLEHNDIDGEIAELESLYPDDLVALPSEQRNVEVTQPLDDAGDLLEALSRTVSGKPGKDYPIYSMAPKTSFSCDGLENGGW